MSDTYRKESRKDWVVKDGGPVHLEQIKLGALQRIADATELMARNHQQLVDERDRWKRWYEAKDAEAKSLVRRNTALKGQITKLKRQLAAWHHPEP